MKAATQFRFKEFAVWHHRSAMKVGVDGVLVGCWTNTDNARLILDVGSGCGLIALIMAQRCLDSKVIGIEIDHDSAEEARINVEASPWSDRVKIIEGSFPEVLSNGENHMKFDLIVSNPPFFDSGLTDIHTSRERARHQGVLSPQSLLADSKSLLNPDGKVAMIVPVAIAATLEEEAVSLGFILTDKCIVRGHKDAPFKRMLLQWSHSEGVLEIREAHIGTLTLEKEPGVPTEQYRELCKNFYLRF